MSYDITQNTWSATLGVAQDFEAGATNVVEALNGLEALAQTLSRPLGLALDEFQRVIELGSAALEAQIRAAIQLVNASRPVHLICARQLFHERRPKD